MADARTALVVEDDPEIRKLLIKYLEKLGLVVHAVGTGKAALQALAELEPPALVCLDLMLPEASGYDICKHIRATEPLSSVPVLIISARSIPPDRAQAEEVGASGYRIKPIRWTSFSAMVRELIGS